MQETTILLLVSRDDFLQRVLTSIELLECDHTRTNILCIVDGPPELYVKARNIVSDMKYNTRLTVTTNQHSAPPRMDIPTRRQRIADAHNQARGLIAHEHGYIFSVEDDTIVPRLALKRLLAVAGENRAFGMAEGVELGRWGVPYVGAWRVNDIYDVNEIKSIEYKDRNAGYEEIDAGGLYCALIRADLYKLHEFHAKNGLGPDVNFGIELRQLGFQNFIHWGVHCKHYNKVMGKETIVEPSDGSQEVTLTKINDVKWHTSY